MQHNHWVHHAASQRSSKHLGRQCLATVALIVSQTTACALAGASDTGDLGFYAGVGVAGIHGSARASGSLVETESDTSSALRLSLGYSAKLTRAIDLGAEFYTYPTHAALGLGDKATHLFGFSILPAYLVLPDTQLFLSLGLERAYTNSPVGNWHRFDTASPAFGGGVSYSLARTLGVPISITAKVEQANYEKISYVAQTDQFKQTRYVFEAEFHF